MDLKKNLRLLDNEYLKRDFGEGLGMRLPGERAGNETPWGKDWE